MRRLMVGVVIASLFLTVLMLLSRVRMLHDEIARLHRERPKAAAPRVVEREPAPTVAEPLIPNPTVPEARRAPDPVVAIETPPPVHEHAPVIELETGKLTFDAAKVALGRVMVATSTLYLHDPLGDLELSDYQKLRIEEAARLRDLARKAADDQYEAAVQTELTQQQREKYQMGRAVVSFGEVLTYKKD